MTQSDLDRVLAIHKEVVEDGHVRTGTPRYRTYAISTLRGGVGKSTLSFNLAYELAKSRSLLVADLCAQCNMSEALMQEADDPPVNIVHALQPVLLGPAFGTPPSDVAYRVSKYCDSFKAVKPTWVIPGSPEMFAFPSTLYQQLQIANAQSNPSAVGALLDSLRVVLDGQANELNVEGILLDTSPFYAGGTHLAWCAADAVVIPVRVDEHSIASLELTLELLSNPNKDFAIWNERAGGRNAPRVAAIVMTMVGSKSQQQSTPDRASRMYIERALSIANNYSHLFDCPPSESFVVTDDFVSSGRISGAKSIPISQLKTGQFHTVEGKRLQVNSSVLRYQRELAYLASVI
ncbi:ParA family protein [Mycobacterium sp. DL99]|uniref:ParA family protein n=1 Tax=Mycobacterium sp. DL99 TaxID=2528957 RepID=UPI001AEBE4B7|nr:ParA family protein [Mycobacterium sp. DL99]